MHSLASEAFRGSPPHGVAGHPRRRSRLRRPRPSAGSQSNAATNTPANKPRNTARGIRSPKAQEERKVKRSIKRLNARRAHRQQRRASAAPAQELRHRPPHDQTTQTLKDSNSEHQRAVYKRPTRTHPAKSTTNTPGSFRATDQEKRSTTESQS